MSRKLTKEEWIENAKKIHGGRYDYSKVEYVHTKVKVVIVCQEHGEFQQSPNSHAKGNGCPKCGRIAAVKTGIGPKKRTIEEVIAAAKQVHGNRYDYSLIESSGVFDKVTIVCAEHGPFKQGINTHLSGSGCPKCFRNRKRLNNEIFILRGKEKYGDLFDYSLIEYVNNTTPVTLICKKHGKFTVIPANHIKRDGGCKECQKEKTSAANVKGNSYFIAKSKEVHKDTYDYSESQYVSAQTPIAIRCRTHGIFHQPPNDHYGGHGCPACAKQKSQPEIDIMEFISQYVGLTNRDRTILKPKEIDIYIPSKSLGIEYCGLYWHRTRKRKPPTSHLSKLTAAQSAGVRLITIFEDEWIHKEKIVKSVLTKLLSPQKGITVLAGSCTLVELSELEAKTFFTEHSLSGHRQAFNYIGLLDDSIGLVSAAAFDVENGEVLMSAVCSKPGVSVQGWISALATAGLRKLERTSVVSYVDRRWFTGTDFLQAGFFLEQVIEPNYWYVAGNTRINNLDISMDQLSNQLKKFNASLTEQENMLANGYHIIHDCGNLKMRLET